jgi:hypothetical protein
MPEHRPAPDAPGRAVDATIARISEELVSFDDPEKLNEIRAAFKRKIPLRLRSYAAALLILEASESKGGKRNQGHKTETDKAERGKDKRREGEGRKLERPAKEGKESREARPEPQVSNIPSEETRPRYKGEATTLFFGMGKRQRLYPRVLLRILTEEGGLAYEEIGDIRSFDNYSFADIDPAKAEALIAALESVVFRGRKLPVGKARKRGESPAAEGAGRGTELETVRDVEEELARAEDEAVEASDSSYDQSFDDADDLSEDFTDQDEGPVDDAEGEGPPPEDEDELNK